MASSNLSTNPTVSDLQRAVKDTVHSYWQLFLTQGVIMVILGILAVVWPQISTVAVDVYVGWLFLLSGIVGIFTMFLARDVQAFLWCCLRLRYRCSLASCCFGIQLKVPYRLPWCLSPSSLSKASFQIAASLSYRDVFPKSWGWMLASGIADLILAALIIKGWPSTATWALGLIVGINLITSGACHNHGGTSWAKPRENVSQRARIGVQTFTIASWQVASEGRYHHEHGSTTSSDSWNSSRTLPRSPCDLANSPRRARG